MSHSISHHTEYVFEHGFYAYNTQSSDWKYIRQCLMDIGE